MSINYQDELALGSGEVFEPEPQEESQQEMDLRLGTLRSFAAEQARLAAAIDLATALLRPHLDSKEPV